MTKNTKYPSSQLSVTDDMEDFPGFRQAVIAAGTGRMAGILHAASVARPPKFFVFQTASAGAYL